MSVFPVEISKSDFLSSVRNEFNAIGIKGDHVGEQVFFGKGAGNTPTADAVVRDVVEIAKEI